MTITNVKNLPLPFVKAVSTEKHNKPGTISATTLLKGVKEIVLSDRHWDELEDDASNRVWTIFGTAVHSIVEQYGEGDFVEKRLEYNTGDMTVTGQVDYFDESTGTLVDWKTCSDVKIYKQDFSDWRKQALIYAWLFQKNGYTVNKAQFIAFIKNFSKMKSKTESNYPDAPVYVVEFDITPQDIDDIEKFILGKIKEITEMQNVKDDDIPTCSAQERWESPTVYAVMKKGLVRSKKNCSTLEEAEQRVAELGKDHYVETRKGTSGKCSDYCICNKFCKFYKELA